MVSVTTERIWTLAGNDAIVPRTGAVTLDIDEVIVDQHDSERALYVADGLQSRDFAVFLQLGNLGLKAPTVAGFLVGSIEKDGSGVLVHSSKVEQSPKHWVTDKIVHTWRYLSHIEPAIYEEFSMHSLGAFIVRRYPTT